LIFSATLLAAIWVVLGFFFSCHHDCLQYVLDFDWYIYYLI
jgi:hypothetical protein